MVAKNGNNRFSHDHIFSYQAEQFSRKIDQLLTQSPDPFPAGFTNFAYLPKRGRVLSKCNSLVKIFIAKLRSFNKQLLIKMKAGKLLGFFPGFPPLANKET